MHGVCNEGKGMRNAGVLQGKWRKEECTGIVSVGEEECTGFAMKVKE